MEELNKAKKNIPNANDKLLYDPNQRLMRRLGNFSMEETEDEEEENIEEASEDKPEELNNSEENIENNDNTISQPIASPLKQAAQGAVDVKKQVLKKKIIMFIAANPWILLVAGVLIFIFIIILMFLGDSSSGGGNGYYSEECNYNLSTVNLTICDTEEVKTLSIKDYVLGTTYELTKNGDYSDETIKALMILVKTNALSYGNYNSDSKSLDLDSCSYGFSQNNEYAELYSEIENYLFVGSSYNQQINNLSSSNALSLNEDIINKMEEVSENSTYKSILNSIYNDSDDEQIVYDNSIFVGDSRTNQMKNYGIISSDDTVYGGGYGYNWFIGNGSFSSDYTNSTGGAIEGVNSKLEAGVNYNIIIWLGINDFSSISADTYFSKYSELASGDWSNHNIYIVEVGPVDERKTSIRNSNVDDFNNKLASLISSSELNNLKYVNINYDIKTYDSEGVHYGSDDYQNIYTMIMNNLGASGNNYKLYDLDSYCEFIVVEDSSYNVLCDAISINNTSLSRSEFIERVQNYFSGNSNNYASVFSSNAGSIYDIAKSNNINPELVVVRAVSEGFSPGGSYNNYWGIGCFNGQGTSACYSYSSFDEGVLGFIKTISRYSSVSAMMSEYAYIGSHWYNPGSWSLGGCKYFNLIKKYMSPTRASEVARACASGLTCSYGGGSNCVATTAEDQLAYSKWQVEQMSDTRKLVFNIGADNCDQYSPNCKIYAQGDPNWSSIRLGTSSARMGDSGCAVTAIAIGISCSGTNLATPAFNPGTFVNTLNSNNCFTGSGGIYWGCAGISKLAPSVKYVGQQNGIKNNSNSDKISYINSFDSGNHFVLLHFVNSAHPRGHYVVYTSVSGNEFVTKDPAGGKISNVAISQVDQIVVYSY